LPDHASDSPRRKNRSLDLDRPDDALEHADGIDATELGGVPYPAPLLDNVDSLLAATNDEPPSGTRHCNNS
jgi:hypothetical protein